MAPASSKTAAAGKAKAVASAALTAGKEMLEAPEAVPAKRPRLDFAGVTAEPAPVQASLDPPLRLPASDAHVNAVPVMKRLIPQIRQRLQRALALDAASQGDVPVHEHDPLRIQASLQTGGLASYKAPWNRTDCGLAIRSTGLYEAGCNVTWLNPGVGDGSAPPVSWSLMCELTDQLFSWDSQSHGGVTSGIRRLIFPTVFPAFVSDQRQLDCEHFAGTLGMAAGHVLLFAWYIGVERALDSGDQTLLLELWQAGLTASVRVRVATDSRDVLLDAMHFNSTLKGLPKGCGDSFDAFASKIKAVASAEQAALERAGIKCSIDSLVKTLAGKGVRFDGTLINRTMYNAAHAIDAALDASSRAILVDLHWLYGPDLFSTSYTKRMRMAHCCQKSASGMNDAGIVDCMRFVLQMVRFSLKAELVRDAKFFLWETMENRETVPRAGRP